MQVLAVAVESNSASSMEVERQGGEQAQPEQGHPHKSETVKGAKAKADAGYAPPTVEKTAAAIVIIDGDEVGERQSKNVAWEVLNNLISHLPFRKQSHGARVMQFGAASTQHFLRAYGPVPVKHLKWGTFAVVCARGIIEDQHEDEYNGVLNMKMEEVKGSAVTGPKFFPRAITVSKRVKRTA
eukprot:3431652-Amphidinium_carterae.1